MIVTVINNPMRVTINPDDVEANLDVDEEDKEEEEDLDDDVPEKKNVIYSDVRHSTKVYLCNTGAYSV